MALQLPLSYASLERIEGTVASDASVSELLDRLPVDQRDAVRAHIPELNAKLRALGDR